MQILLAEDDIFLGETLARALRLSSWNVVWVHDGRPVLDAVKQSSFDVILLDVGLPFMDGFEALRCLRAQGSDIGILAVKLHKLSAKHLARS